MNSPETPESLLSFRNWKREKPDSASRSPCIVHVVSSVRITSGLAFLIPWLQTRCGRTFATLFSGLVVPRHAQFIGYRAANTWSGDWFSARAPILRVHQVAISGVMCRYRLIVNTELCKDFHAEDEEIRRTC